ncbi:MAG: ABC transporter ATP-binding protein [Bacteroidetes bacterium]|nr:MAG: ABC transporter ATP-binding protein [Bacteroidota bacterium]
MEKGKKLRDIMKNKLKLFRESLKLVWKSAPGWALANTVMSVFRSIFPLLIIWLLKGVIDGITNAATAHPGTPIVNVIWPIIAVSVIWFLDEASSDFSNYVRKNQSLKLEVYMYGLLHTKAIKLDLINFECPEYFDCLARASREAPWRPNSILNNLVAMLRGFLSILLMAGLILTLHWTLAVLLVVANIPGIWLRLHYADILYNFQRQQTPEARKSAYFNWLLTGDRPSRELRIFGLGNYFMDLFKKSFLKQKEEEINIIRKRTLIELISNFCKAFALLVTLLFVAHETIGGKLSLGQMAMFLMAFRQGMIYIRDLFTSVGGLYEDSLFIGDTFEFLNLKENIIKIEPAIIPAPLKKKIVLDNISFTYPANNFRTISNVSFEMKKGEIIALVGPNGAGKSTLVRLLCRLYDPDSGTVRYDDTDIKSIDPEEYRKHFSFVFQDFMLYNLPAGENIRLGNIEDKKPAERIKSSAVTTGVDELIENLPKGYDTVIGNLFDDSRELSWGEWQKIALARALFRNAPVLILDEPSSALDADAEYELFNKFREIVKGRTSILISHRFTNVSLADRIIVLSKGTIAETGTHDELMKQGGMYFTMFTKQSSRFDK